MQTALCVKIVSIAIGEVVDELDKMFVCLRSKMEPVSSDRTKPLLSEQICSPYFA